MFERSFVARWWRKRQRQIDRDILFPAINRQASSHDKATIAIDFHILHDSAWAYPDEWNGKEPIENDESEKTK